MAYGRRGHEDQTDVSFQEQALESVHRQVGLRAPGRDLHHVHRCPLQYYPGTCGRGGQTIKSPDEPISVLGQSVLEDLGQGPLALHHHALLVALEHIVPGLKGPLLGLHQHRPGDPARGGTGVVKYGDDAGHWQRPLLPRVYQHPDFPFQRRTSWRWRRGRDAP